MSIILYSGIPGSGKSYHAMSELITQAKFGKNIICNFPVQLQSYNKKLAKKCKPIFLTDDELTVDYLVNFANTNHKPRKENQTLVIVDECSIKFNSRDFNSPDRKNWLNFFATHRHYGFSFILICQNDKQIDKQIRANIEFEYQHLNLKTFNFIGYITAFIFKMPVFVVRKFMYTAIGNAHSKAQRCGFAFLVFNKKKARIYDTFRKFDKRIDASINSNTGGDLIDLPIVR